MAVLTLVSAPNILSVMPQTSLLALDWADTTGLMVNVVSVALAILAFAYGVVERRQRQSQENEAMERQRRFALELEKVRADAARELQEERNRYEAARQEKIDAQRQVERLEEEKRERLERAKKVSVCWDGEFSESEAIRYGVEVHNGTTFPIRFVHVTVRRSKRPNWVSKARSPRAAGWRT